MKRGRSGKLLTFSTVHPGWIVENGAEPLPVVPPKMPGPLAAGTRAGRYNTDEHSPIKYVCATHTEEGSCLEAEHQPHRTVQRPVHRDEGRVHPLHPARAVGHPHRGRGRQDHSPGYRPRTVHPVFRGRARGGGGQDRCSRQAVLGNREEPARRGGVCGSYRRSGLHHLRHLVVLHPRPERRGLPRLPPRGNPSADRDSLPAVLHHGEARVPRGVQGREPRHPHRRAHHPGKRRAAHGGHRLLPSGHYRRAAGRDLGR